MEVRHSSFSPLAAAALSTIAATSTLWAGAAGAAEAEPELAGADPIAGALPPAGAGAAPPGAGVALA